MALLPQTEPGFDSVCHRLCASCSHAGGLSCYHLLTRIGNNFTQASLCVCVCVSIQIQICHIWVKSKYKDYWIKIKVKWIKLICYLNFTSICLYSTQTSLKGQSHLNVKVNITQYQSLKNLFSVSDFNCFVICVLHGWYAFDWKAFFYCNTNALQAP